MSRNGKHNRQRREVASQINLDPATQRQQIEERAYAKFLERGGVPGHDVEDWLTAEQEILAGTRASAAK